MIRTILTNSKMDSILVELNKIIAECHNVIIGEERIVAKYNLSSLQWEKLMRYEQDIEDDMILVNSYITTLLYNDYTLSEVYDILDDVYTSYINAQEFMITSLFSVNTCTLPYRLMPK